MSVELNTIYNEDCLETMKRMPNNLVDCVLTSPPYNMRTRVRNGQYAEREKKEHFSKKYSHFSDALPPDQYYRFHKSVIVELLRLSPLVFWNIQIVTGNKQAVFDIIGNFSKYIKDIIVWDKGDGQPAMHPAVINRSYELIIVFQSDASIGRAFKQFYFKRGEMSDIWRLGRGGVGRIAGHAAVFPLSLAKKIIRNWTKEGDVVYDPFMGSGTTARACKDLNRYYIGSEISKEYCDLAERRLGQEVLL